MSRSAALAALVMLAALAPLAARSQDEPSVRSTGQVEVAIEPARTTRIVKLELPAPGASSTHEATQRRGEAIEHVFEDLGGGMLEIRVAARDGSCWMSVFRDDAESPEAGTRWDQRTVMWLGTAGTSKKLRVVSYVDAAETPYRVTVKRRSDEDSSD